MDYFAGLDVSVKDTSVCIVDSTGKIIREVKVASEPDTLLAVLRSNLRLVMIAETLASPILFGLARDGGRFRILGLNPMRRAPRAISQLTMKTFLVPTLREE